MAAILAAAKIVPFLVVYRVVNLYSPSVSGCGPPDQQKHRADHPAAARHRVGSGRSDEPGQARAALTVDMAGGEGEHREHDGMP
jgi:hypothetical protein